MKKLILLSALSLIACLGFSQTNGYALTNGNNLIVGTVTVTATTGTMVTTSSVLPVVNGGTNQTALTSGSALFFDGTRVQQNNTKYFWDNSSIRLGINNGAPFTTLDVVETSSVTPRGILSEQYSTDIHGGRIDMRKARGTFSSPSVIVTADIVGSFSTWGYDGSAFIEASKIITTSIGTIGTNTVAATMKLQTANPSGTITTGITIDQNQIVTFGGGVIYPYVAKTSNYTIDSGTAKDYFVNCTSGTFTITLPTAVSQAGRVYVIKNSGTGVITIATSSSQTIDGAASLVFGQYVSYTIASNGANWFIL